MVQRPGLFDQDRLAILWLGDLDSCHEFVGLDFPLMAGHLR